MISLERRHGRPLRIGHRGAAALSPENTLRSFRAALEVGVDLIELDVFELHAGELIIAHSDDLHELSHGRHHGKIGDRSLAALRDLCPELPTLEEALAFFVDEAPGTGIHVDLKVRGRESDVATELTRLGLVERSFVSSFDPRSVRTLATLEPRLRVGLTVPRSVLGISEDGRGAPIARVGLAALRRVMPLLAGPALSMSRAMALALHHSLVRPDVVRRAHARGAPVVAWTVDDSRELARVDAAGVDAVVTNDPAIFASTLET